MADCLVKNNKNDLAKNLYDTLCNGHKVLELYELEEEEKKKKGKKQEEFLKFLISYMLIAKKYHRNQIAIKKAQ